jgi:hypothetical protein
MWLSWSVDEGETMNRARWVGCVLGTGIAVGLVAVGQASAAPVTSAPADQPQRAVLAYARAALHGLHIGSPARGLHVTAGSGLFEGTTDVTSSNWSGYADNESSNIYKSVSAEWAEPTGSCGPSQSLSAFWVGLDGYSSGTVEQDGTLIECYGGTPYYFDWWEMYPYNSVQLVATVGGADVITAAVKFRSGAYLLSVTDATHPAASFSTSQSAAVDCSASACDNANAEWISEAPCCVAGGSVYPLTDYGKWKVSNATVKSGTVGTISSFPNDNITMTNASNSPLSVAGPLATGGSSFKTKWIASG